LAKFRINAKLEKLPGVERGKTGSVESFESSPDQQRPSGKVSLSRDS